MLAVEVGAGFFSKEKQSITSSFIHIKVKHMQRQKARGNVAVRNLITQPGD